MKKLITGIALTCVLITLSGCKKWLDVNRNPNGPDAVAANLYLAPMLQGVVLGEQWDGRFISRYIQNWSSINDSDIWDKMGYQAPPSDNGGELWKTTYFVLGQNLLDMMTKAEAENRYDILGVGYILKAIGYQKSTAVNGEIIVKEALMPNKSTFAYDNQDFVYQEIDRLLGVAITNLERTDGTVSSTYLSKGDIVYGGNREKWLKFAYGLRAITLNHLTNKSGLYDPAKVIEYVDKSFANSTDDAFLTFTSSAAGGGSSALANFWGQMRGNLNTVRQTQYIVALLDGTVFGTTPDPRLGRMLQASPNGKFTGLQPTYATTATYPTVADRPNSFFGTAGNVLLTSTGRYLFDDKAKAPLMTYFQLQFVKAEAAILANNKALALDAYKNAVLAHLNFVNAANASVTNNTATQMSPAEITAFMADPKIVPTSASNLTLKHVMSQKYIAQFAWAFVETWTDLRRYHYTDIDPTTGEQIFKGFMPVEVGRLFADNLGELTYRLRPRYASEYVWNVPALTKIGGMEINFQATQPWIFKK